MSVRNRQSLTGVPPPGANTTADERAYDAQTADATSEGGGQMTLPLSTEIDVTRAAEAYEMNEFNAETVRDEGAVGMIGGAEGEHASLGQRLRAGREARGWSRADVAARLKLPLNLVAKLESDDYEGLTEGVFLRGYLGSYARLVEVPVEEVASIAQAHSRPAPLVATGTISRSRYLFDRYSVSATYLVLTAIIVVPAVWLATHGGLEQNLARTTPLDPPANVIVPLHSGAPDAAGSNPAETAPTERAIASTATDGTAESTAAPPAPVEQAPVIASMTPFTTAPALPPAEPPKPADDAVGSGAHTLQLKLSQASWVEILGTNGQRLEYGTLTAGSERSYRSDSPLSVRLGNVQGAEVRSDGKLIDLAPFQRGNVVHVKLFEGSASRVEQQ
jgi:cytoskeleton protein RodZ